LIALRHIKIAAFLPVQEMPATLAFLRHWGVSNNADENRSLLVVLAYFAKRPDFTAVFDPQLILQLLEREPQALDVLLPTTAGLLQNETVATPEFLVEVFEFVYILGNREAKVSKKKITEVFQEIVRRIRNKAVLREIVAANCDIELPAPKAFISAIIDENPELQAFVVVEDFYKSFQS
jgi:hypothetical protein